LPGGELIDRLQNIAGNVADRQHLNSRRLRQWSDGSGALTSSCPKIKLSPPFPAISAASVVIVLFIYIYFVHHLILRETAGRSSEKSSRIFQKLQKRLIEWLTVTRLRWKIRGNLAKKLRCRNCE
jgi:hypothetical protein